MDGKIESQQNSKETENEAERLLKELEKLLGEGETDEDKTPGGFSIRGVPAGPDLPGVGNAPEGEAGMENVSNFERIVTHLSDLIRLCCGILQDCYSREFDLAKVAQLNNMGYGLARGDFDRIRILSECKEMLEEWWRLGNFQGVLEHSQILNSAFRKIDELTNYLLQNPPRSET